MREAKNAHRGFVLWLTGLSGSGKSTLANELDALFFKKGCNTVLLDGDNMRHGLNSDLKFSKADRAENIRRVGEVAKLLTESGMIVIAALISPFRKDRDKVRRSMRNGDYIEVFLDCGIKTCIKRDPKGLYVRVKAKKINEFTGLTSPYEKPLKPEIVLNTANFPVSECADAIYSYLKSKGRLS